MWLGLWLWLLAGPIHGQPRIVHGEKDCTPIGYVWPVTSPEPIPIYPRGCDVPAYRVNR